MGFFVDLTVAWYGGTTSMAVDVGDNAQGRHSAELGGKVEKLSKIQSFGLKSINFVIFSLWCRYVLFGLKMKVNTWQISKPIFFYVRAAMNSQCL